MIEGAPRPWSASAASPPAARLGTPPPSPAGAFVTGTLPSTTPLSIVVALKPAVPSALASYATEVSTPGSSVYHHYLTVAEFRQMLAPGFANTRAPEFDASIASLIGGVVGLNSLSIPHPLDLRAPRLALGHVSGSLAPKARVDVYHAPNSDTGLIDD